MKRILAIFLVFCLILCGCGSAPDDATKQDISHTTELFNISEETSPTIPPETMPPTPSTAVISEMVVFDNGDFKLTAKEIDFTDDYDVKVKFLAENNTDKNVSILGQYFSINGITMYCSFYIEVAAGKKANEFLEIDRDDLAYVGIKDIATIKAQDCYIYDKDISKKIIDFKFDLVTSIADGYQQEIDRSGQTVYDQNGIIVKYRGIVPGSFGDEELEFYVENISDANIGVYVDNVSVNGFMIYGNMVAYAFPGCVTYATLDFSSSDLEKNDIEAIEEVSLNLYGYDQDASKKIWTSEEFTVGRTASIDSNNSVSDLTSSTESTDTAIEAVALIIESTLKKDYDSAYVNCDGSTIDINLSYPGLASTVQSMISSKDQKQLETWNLVVDSFVKTNLAAIDICKDFNISDATVILNIRNDLNPENILLTILGDTVIYDVVNSK